MWSRRPSPSLPVYIAHFGGATKQAATQLAFQLRAAGIGARLAFSRRGRSMKSQMREADRLAARYALILGDSELAEGMVAVKPPGRRRADACAIGRSVRLARR